MASHTMTSDNKETYICGAPNSSQKQREVDEQMTSDNVQNHQIDKANRTINKINLKHKLIRTFNQPKKRLLTIGLAGVLCVIISYGIFMFSPVAMIIKSKLQFSEGTEAYALWKDPPIKIFIMATVFNVMNPKQFLDGKEKLRVEEVGPFYYRESLKFTNVTFNDNGTVTYISRRKLTPAPEMSHLNPDTQRVIVPNVPLLGIASMLHDASFATNLGLNFLTNYIDSQSFLNLTVTEFLFGYEDQLVQLAGTFIPSWIPFKTFGLLERMFAEGENIVTMTLKSNGTEPMGTDHDADYNGQYLTESFNGGEENPSLVANSPNRQKPNRCTSLRGTSEGTRFNMNVNPNVTYWVYRKAFCRSLPMQYVKQTISRRGYKAFQYKFAEGTFDSPKDNPNNFCYYKEGSTSLMPSGLSALTSCYYGIPVAASFPHFYKSDPSLVEAVDGMRPDASKHESQVLIQPELGVVLEAMIRMQMNVYVFDTKFNPKLKRFNNMAVPLFWIQWYSNDLGQEIYTLMNLALYVGPTLEFGLVVVICLVGLAMIGFSVVGTILSRRMRRATDAGEPSMMKLQTVS